MAGRATDEVETGTYAFDGFELNVAKPELTHAGIPVEIYKLSLRLLGVLVQRAGQLVTKEQLLDLVWDGRAVSDNVLTVAITRLRKTLDRESGAGSAVVNVHGRGYRFVREVTRRESGDAERVATSPTPIHGAPFVGRDQILSYLRSAVAEAHGGSGSVVLLTGEAGIGKTRLAELVDREASARGLAVAWGHCREVGDTPPLWPFAQLLRDVVEHVGLPLSDARLSGLLPELSRLVPEWSKAAHHAAGAAAVGGKLGNKHRIFDAIVRALTLATECTPCLLVLDDLHRADPASLELLNYFIAEVPRLRLLLLATLRLNTGAAPATLARVLGHRNSARISLPRLTEADVGQYLEAALGSADSALRGAVFAYSEGNPFFMTECTRQARLHRADDPSHIALPAAALDILRQRVNALEENVRSTLSCAAVIGRSFSLSALQAITGDDVAILMNRLDAAVASEIVAPKGEARSEFAFDHELLRAVLYDALAPAERRRLHLSVARALEERSSHELIPPADLAYHARCALPLGDLRKAVCHCIAAGAAAAHVFAYADAARHLEHALEALEMQEHPNQTWRIQLLLHQALLTRAHSTRAFQPLIARVVHLAHEQQQADPLARAAMLHDPYPGLPPLPGSVRAFEDALRLLLADPGKPPLRAAMLARLATSAPAAFSATASAELLARAEAFAGSSAEILDGFSVRVARLYLHGGPLQRADAERLMREITDICRSSGMLSIPPVMIDLHRALNAFQDGDLASMHAALERGTSRCRDLDSELIWLFERGALLARLNAGEGSPALQALGTLHERARRLSIVGTELFCAYDDAVFFGATVKRNPALRAAFAAADNDRPNIWSLKLRGLQAAGLTDDAREALARVAPGDLAALPLDRDYLGTLGALARVAIELRALDYAEALYGLLAPYPDRFAVHVSFWCEGSVSQLLGMLAALLGQPERAHEHLQAAVEASRHAGLVACERSARAELGATSPAARALL